MKRFTETDKWKDPWFRALPSRQKHLWLWLLDNCDCAGVVPEIDWALVSFQIGESVTADDMAVFSGRIEPCGKGWWIMKFVAYQYGRIEKATASKLHIGVLKALDRASISLSKAMQSLPKGSAKPSESLSKAFGKASESLKEKDKEKDKGSEGEAPKISAADIYEAYPRKVARQHAISAIEKALAETPAFALLEATRAYAAAVAEWPEQDRQYIPHPATWFNRGSYLDDRSTWRRQGAQTDQRDLLEVQL